MRFPILAKQVPGLIKALVLQSKVVLGGGYSAIVEQADQYISGMAWSKKTWL